MSGTMFHRTDPRTAAGTVPGSGNARGREGGLCEDLDLAPPVPAALPYTPPLAGPFGALLVLAMALAGLG